MQHILNLEVRTHIPQHHKMLDHYMSTITHTLDISTDTPGLSAEGITGRVLLILSAVIQLLVWTVAFVAVACRILGLFMCVIDYIRLHLELCAGTRKLPLHAVLFVVYFLGML